ncbi:hypothetical protein C8R44DRAFT_876076 [Mycena epipterygia]|nr:hypothetical protein C8R44DRAFT_876076 [Mycena epipterygia]
MFKGDTSEGVALVPENSQSLQQGMEKIGIQTCECEDATQLSRILSPKVPPLGPLLHYKSVVDEPKFIHALESAKTELELASDCPSTERKHLPKFLNACVKLGVWALTDVGLLGSWYDDSGPRFVAYDGRVGFDGVDGASVLYWTTPEELESCISMQLPVEVDNDCLSQSATCARCLFRANPKRTFALLLVYDRPNHELRFLVFHRGGLTSHKVRNFEEPQGRAEALRLIMTILLRSEPQHTGLISTFNGFQYWLPRSLNTEQPRTVKEIPYDSVRVRGRGTAQTGHSLLDAKSSYELCMALVDALLGWLSLYQSGFMHCDIGIANVLLTEGGSTSKPFNIVGDILTAVWSPVEDPSLSATPASSNSIKIQASRQPASESPIHQLAAEIKVLVEKLQVERKCTAFVTGGDLAINWRTYFSNQHDLETRSGTVHFISFSLQRAMETNCDYIHSPLDDLESFFWLAFWAVIFNKQNKTRSVDEVHWQQFLKRGGYGAKAAAANLLRDPDVSDPNYSSISNEFIPLLQSLYKIQDDLRASWRAEMRKAKTIPETQLTKFYLYHFHLYALLGVRDILFVVAKNCDELKSYKAFPSQ